MKPKLFIGSSKEGLDVAHAIHSQLRNDAECKVWKDAFPLGSYTLSSIIEAACASDFGVFVFSPDDTLETRGQRFLVARDNVLYELGLFTGILTPSRCFFVLPDGVPVHKPSDLQGITSGTYEADRTDGDWNSAVSPFCNEVRTRITQLGFAQEPVPAALRELAVKYECCDWIYDHDRRPQQKLTVVTEMISFCRKNNNEINKNRISVQHRAGWNIVLCATIQAHPLSSDVDLLLAIKPDEFTQGVAQSTVISTIDTLETRKKISKAKAPDFVTWLQKLHNPVPDDARRITNLVARLSYTV